MILLLDNYDSFVHNLSRYFVELGEETLVVRNDEITVETIQKMSPTAIVISPGPCTPAEAGVSVSLIQQLYSSVPILGICLGHQSIATALGGNVVRAKQPVHGKRSLVTHHQKGLFKGLPHPLQATRYHSLIVEEATLPKELEVIARLEDETVMAIKHTMFPLFGVQFHPESVLTESGHLLLANFLESCSLSPSQIPSGDYTFPPQEPSWVDDDWASGQPLHW